MSIGQTYRCSRHGVTSTKMEDRSGNTSGRGESDVRGNGLAIAGDSAIGMAAEPSNCRTRIDTKRSDEHAGEGVMTCAICGGALTSSKDAAASNANAGVTHRMTGPVLHCSRYRAFY